MIAALILPPDLLDKLRSLATLNPQQPEVEVLVNQDDPVKASLVDDRIQALITEANLILAQRISDEAANYLDLIVKGGSFASRCSATSTSSASTTRRRSWRRSAGSSSPAAPRSRRSTASVEFADVAGENLDLALPLLGAIAEPIRVDKQVVAGDSPRSSTTSRSRSRRR